MRFLSVCVRPAALLLAASAFWVSGVPAPAEARGDRDGRRSAAPRLIEPGETVDPSVPAVRFRWTADAMPGDTHRYDDFRLFRGNQAFSGSMVHDAEVPPGQGWIEVPSDFVKEPGIYCWTVRRVGARQRSREAFSVFKVEGRS